MYVCMYMYVCMFPKYSQNGTRQRKNFRATLPFVCGVQYHVLFKLGNEKMFEKSIPDSGKYSSGVFDQCKQPQQYSSLELSLVFFK